MSSVANKTVTSTLIQWNHINRGLKWTLFILLTVIGALTTLALTISGHAWVLLLPVTFTVMGTLTTFTFNHQTTHTFVTTIAGAFGVTGAVVVGFAGWIEPLQTGANLIILSLLLTGISILTHSVIAYWCETAETRL